MVTCHLCFFFPPPIFPSSPLICLLSLRTTHFMSVLDFLSFTDTVQASCSSLSSHWDIDAASLTWASNPHCPSGLLTNTFSHFAHTVHQSHLSSSQKSLMPQWRCSSFRAVSLASSTATETFPLWPLHQSGPYNTTRGYNKYSMAK